MKNGAVALYLDVQVNAPVDLDWTYSYSVARNGVGSVEEFGPSSPRTAMGGTSRKAAERIFLETINLPSLDEGYYELTTTVDVAPPRGSGIVNGATFVDRLYFAKLGERYFYVDDIAEWYAENAVTAREFDYAGP